MLSNQKYHHQGLIVWLVLLCIVTSELLLTASPAASARVVPVVAVTAFVVHPKSSSSSQRHGRFIATSALHMKPTDSSTSTGTSIPNTFPASTRQALIQKAKELNQFPTTATNTTNAYSTVGWSNRLGTVLIPAAIPGVYTADRPFYWNKIDVGCRMTVIELPTSTNTQSLSSKPDLWIHSPVALDGPLKKILAELGTVRHVVSPNYEHVKFASAWAVAYPNATLWACPGMKSKLPNAAPWNQEIPQAYNPSLPELWPGIQTYHMNLEVNPFTNTPFFNECIFFHTPSQTLLTTDLYWNYPQRDGIPNSHIINKLNSNNKNNINDDDNTDDLTALNGPWELAPSVDKIPFGSQLWKFAMDYIYLPFYSNFMIQDKNAFSKSILETVLCKEWKNVQTLIPAHGDIIRGTETIQSVWKQHFGVN